MTSFPTVIVCGPHDPNRFKSPKFEAWLRRLARGGTRLGALDTGAYVLAQARLLAGHRCTIHWENLPGFVAAFPGIEVSSELYEFDRNRFTCGGGTAALDILTPRWKIWSLWWDSRARSRATFLTTLSESNIRGFRR